MEAKKLDEEKQTKIINKYEVILKFTLLQNIGKKSKIFNTLKWNRHIILILII